jgi:hypothetical protein
MLIVFLRLLSVMIGDCQFYATNLKNLEIPRIQCIASVETNWASQ